MENQRQKWVNLIFTGVAILVWGIAFIGLSKVSALYNWESTIKQIDLYIRIGSLIIGAAIGFGLYLNDKSNAFMNEVVLELARVTWPTTNDTYKATFLVVGFVIVAGLFLAGFDSLFTWVMKLIL